MADFVVSDSSLSSIANAIRERGDTSSPLVYPDGFVSAINAIPFKGAIGTFKGTVTGVAMDVPLRYDGDGYPISVVICPAEGTYNSSGTFFNSLQRYAMVYWIGMKNEIPSVPTYRAMGARDQMSYVMAFKNSTTSPLIFGTSNGPQMYVYRDLDAASSLSQCVRLKNKNLMSVFIASSGYGFMANVDYSYAVVYSS